MFSYLMGEDIGKDNFESSSATIKLSKSYFTIGYAFP